MKRIITKEVFDKIFSNKEYRKKFDYIFLEYFGLSYSVPTNECSETDTYIEFNIYLNTDKIHTIRVKNNKYNFKENKRLFVNFSYMDVERYRVLLIPNYWEIYTKYCLKHKNNKKLLLFAGLFASTSIDKCMEIFKNLKMFNEEELEDIKNILISST